MSLLVNVVWRLHKNVFVLGDTSLWGKYCIIAVYVIGSDWWQSVGLSICCTIVEINLIAGF